MRYHHWAFALAAAAALAGCKSKGNAAGGDVTSSAAPAGSTAVAPESSATASSNAQLSTANIASLVDEVNMGDSSLAAAAMPKLKARAAKNFAKMMMGEHHALHVQGLKVETKEGLAPQAPSTDPFKDAVSAEQQAMASASAGHAADSTYIANEIAIHQAVIQWAGQPQNQPSDSAYATYMKSVAPVLEKHLKAAQAAQTALEKGGMAKK